MKVVIYSSHGFDRPYLETALSPKYESVFFEEKLDLHTAQYADGAGAVALFTSDTANAAILEQLHTLGIKYIALRSAGYDHVDLVKAKQLNIRVANVPAYSPYSVAEHAVAMLMAVNRKIVLSQKLMDIGDYRLDLLTGFDLFGKTVGVIGTGNIGAAFARIMLGFGCTVLANDPSKNEALQNLGLQYVSLDEMYARADVISVHCPLNEHTSYLLSGEAFDKMKKGVTIVNTSRGKIIDTAALIKALDAGIVQAAALDVYEFEKAFFFHDLRGQRLQDELFLRLRSYPNVLITGHQAFLTKEALAGIAATTAGNLDSWGSAGSSENDLW